jgi:hypothetical protein
MSEHEDHENDLSEGHYLSKIPLTTLYRWFMYDIHTENPNNHVDIFKITAVSDEGDEKEQEESRLRMEQIQELLPLMNLYSTMTAQYVFEMQKREVIDEVSPEIAEKLEKDSNKMKQFYKLISLSALMTMLSSAVELGILSTEGSLIDVDEIKE